MNMIATAAASSINTAAEVVVLPVADAAHAVAAFVADAAVEAIPAAATEVVANTSAVIVDAGAAVIEITAKEGMITRIIGATAKNVKSPYVLGAVAVAALGGAGYLAYKKYVTKKASA